MQPTVADSRFGAVRSAVGSGAIYGGAYDDQLYANCCYSHLALKREEQMGRISREASERRGGTEERGRDKSKI